MDEDEEEIIELVVHDPELEEEILELVASPELQSALRGAGVV